MTSVTDRDEKQLVDPGITAPSKLGFDTAEAVSRAN